MIRSPRVVSPADTTKPVKVIRLQPPLSPASNRVISVSTRSRSLFLQQHTSSSRKAQRPFFVRRTHLYAPVASPASPATASTVSSAALTAARSHALSFPPDCAPGMSRRKMRSHPSEQPTGQDHFHLPWRKPVARAEVVLAGDIPHLDHLFST